MSDFTDAGVLDILAGGSSAPLTVLGLSQVGLACWSEGQELGDLQVWGTLDGSGGRIVSLDIFDDDFEILGGDQRWGNIEYAAFLAQFSQYVVTSFLDDNLAVDVNFETPSSFRDPAVRRVLIDSLALTKPPSALYENLRDYCAACLAA